MSGERFDFARIDDWTAYLRDLIERPLGHEEIAVPGCETIGTRSTINAFATSLADTPYLAPLLEAAITLVEAGRPEEVAIAGTLPFGEPQADRIVELLVRVGPTLPAGAFSMMAGRALAHRAGDPRVAAALAARAARVPAEAPNMLELALYALPAWVVDHLAAFADARHDPEGSVLAVLIARAEGPTRKAILDAIAAAGPEFVSRALDYVRSYPEVARARVRADLAAHPAFRHTPI